MTVIEFHIVCIRAYVTMYQCGGWCGFQCHLGTPHMMYIYTVHIGAYILCIAMCIELLIQSGVCVYVYVHMRACVHVCVYVHVYVHMRARVCVCVCVGQTLKNPEEKLARWQRHFAKVLNIQNGVAEEVV